MVECEHPGACVSALARSVGWVGSGAGTGWCIGGVSVLPRAQEWCGWDRDLGSSGTWLALEFYCVPARASHSHASEYGRTEGRKEREQGRRKGGVGEREGEQSRVRDKQSGREGRSCWNSEGVQRSAFCATADSIFFWYFYD